jgi:acyl-CoA synthetase (AMP-forming)/AMP-acid ligase II
MTTQLDDRFELLAALSRRADQKISIYEQPGPASVSTYGELSTDVTRLCAALPRPDHRNTPIYWCCSLSRNAVAWDIACLVRGYVSVPLAPEAWQAYEKSAPVRSIDGYPIEHVVGESIDLEGPELTTIKASSGSTGVAKLVPARRAHVEHTLLQSEIMFSLGPSDAVLVCLPLSVFLQRIVTYMALRAGAELHISTPLRSLSAARVARPTCTAVVPGILDSWRTAAQARQRPLGELLGGRMRWVWCGSAPIARTAVEELDRQGVPIFQGYGMSEVGFIAKNYPGHNRVGSVGPIFPGVELRFGEDGEIQVTSRFLPSEVYLDTDRAFARDGWVRTGDRGHIDGGYLYVSGRVDDRVVATNGKKATFTEIESMAMQVRATERALIVATKGEGQVLLVWSTLDAKAWLSAARASTLSSFLGGTLNAWALIDAPMPALGSKHYAPSGKILRHSLIELYEHSTTRGRFDAAEQL